MSDVATTCISGNPQRSGYVVTAIPTCRAAGITTQVKAPKIQRQTDSANLETKYGTRFDDPRYYSGDAAT